MRWALESVPHCHVVVAAGSGGARPLQERAAIALAGARSHSLLLPVGDTQQSTPAASHCHTVLRCVSHDRLEAASLLRLCTVSAQPPDIDTTLHLHLLTTNHVADVPPSMMLSNLKSLSSAFAAHSPARPLAAASPTLLLQSLPRRGLPATSH